MKRFLFVLAILLLIAAILPSVSIADGFDLSSMSLEELLTLRNDINDEINKRVIQPSMAIYNGAYIVGVDIKAGRYLFTVEQPVIDGSIDYASMYIITSDDELTFLFHAGESMILDLVDGMKLEIESVLSATLTDVPPASYAP